MGLSLGLYGIAFVLFAAGTLMQSVWFIFAALLVFASAECTYAPLTNVAMVESGENMPLVDILNCRLILTAIGESIGSFVADFRAFSHIGFPCNMDVLAGFVHYCSLWAFLMYPKGNADK